LFNSPSLRAQTKEFYAKWKEKEEAQNGNAQAQEALEKEQT